MDLAALIALPVVCRMGGGPAPNMWDAGCADRTDAGHPVAQHMVAKNKH